MYEDCHFNFIKKKLFKKKILMKSTDFFLKFVTLKKLLKIKISSYNLLVLSTQKLLQQNILNILTIYHKVSILLRYFVKKKSHI